MDKKRFIAAVDQTSGLPPATVGIINSNFWNLLEMFSDPDVVAVSSINAPEPRTDETLWYKPDTGVLYIWHNGAGGWGWTELASVALSNDYSDLDNKPTITEPVYLSDPPATSTVVISGDNSFDDLGMKRLTNLEIQDIINLVDSTM